MKNLVIYIFNFLVLISIPTNAQNEEKEALTKLSFMIGNWKGTSISYNQTSKKSVEVTEEVRYIMDGNLLVLNVKSPWIALHTIISYDVTNKNYYYHPFSKKGLRDKYKGTFENGVFRVYFNNKKRLTFTTTPKGEFHEFGEELKDHKWQKYFEDILQPITPNK